MSIKRKIVDVQFYKSDTGSVPVKRWLKKLGAKDRKIIGDDIRTIEFGWPIGMPLVKKIETNLWEVRSTLSNNRISRVLFTVYSDMMILLHAFVKKTPKMPKNDLSTAKRRMSYFFKGENK